MILWVPVISLKTGNLDVTNQDFYLRSFFRHGLLKFDSESNVTNFKLDKLFKLYGNLSDPTVEATKQYNYGKTHNSAMSKIK